MNEGIGGRDAFILMDLNLKSVAVTGAPKGNIHVNAGNDTLIFTREQVRNLVDWLESWDYL